MTSLARLVWVPLLVLGCGGRIDSGGDAAADASPPPSDAQPPPWDAQPPLWDAQPPPPLDGGECNSLGLMGPMVPFQQLPSVAPSLPASSATPFPGAYVLVAFTMYTGPNGSGGTIGQGAVTVQFAPALNGFDVQAVAQISGQPLERSSSIATISGSSQITFAEYCPQGGGPAGPALTYAFDGSTLWLRADSGGGNMADEQYALVTN